MSSKASKKRGRSAQGRKLTKSGSLAPISDEVIFKDLDDSRQRMESKKKKLSEKPFVFKAPVLSPFEKGEPYKKATNESHQELKANYLVHQMPVPSILSHESPSQNYRGLLNLAGLVLIVTNFRLVMENSLKYGILIDLKALFASMVSGDSTITPAVVALAGVLVYMMVAHAIEVVAAGLYRKAKIQMDKEKKNVVGLPEGWIALGHTLNIIMCFAVPVTAFYSLDVDSLAAVAVLFVTVIIAMKLISFAATNREYRLSGLSPPSAIPTPPSESVFGAEGVEYPDNIALGRTLYFMAAPTLCYQLEYPRTRRIRWLYCAGMLGQFVFLSVLQMFLLRQYVVPTVENSMEAFDNRNVLKIIERTLKLAVPNLYIWLIGFYSFFHCWLNLLSELLRFGDRRFYMAWWNCTTLAEYWRLWNLPVHHWALRHVYYPLRRRGWSSTAAGFVIFIISGLGHELLVSVPCKTISFYVFASFIGQVPVIELTRKRLKGRNLGNVFFWFMFCIAGQPLCILVYAYMVHKRYDGDYPVFG